MFRPSIPTPASAGIRRTPGRRRCASGPSPSLSHCAGFPSTRTATTRTLRVPGPKRYCAASAAGPISSSRNGPSRSHWTLTCTRRRPRLNASPGADCANNCPRVAAPKSMADGPSLTAHPEFACAGSMKLIVLNNHPHNVPGFNPCMMFSLFKRFDRWPAQLRTTRRGRAPRSGRTPDDSADRPASTRAIEGRAERLTEKSARPPARW